MELEKDSDKGLAQRLSTPSSDCTEPMDTDNDALAQKDPAAAAVRPRERKSAKAVTSNFSQSFPSRVPSSCVDVKQEREAKDKDTDKEDSKKRTVISEARLEQKSGKVGPKSPKTELCPAAKPCRPSSTPPSDAGKVAWE